MARRGAKCVAVEMKLEKEEYNGRDETEASSTLKTSLALPKQSMSMYYGKRDGHGSIGVARTIESVKNSNAQLLCGVTFAYHCTDLTKNSSFTDS